MSQVVTIVLVSISAGSALVGAARGALERRRARRELRVRPALEGKTPEGEVVRATGVVRVLERKLVAPLSGTLCVVARSRVKAGGWIARPALVPFETFAMVPFLLERANGEGTVSIEGVHAALDLDPIKRVGKRAKTAEDKARRDAFAIVHGITERHVPNAIYEETVVEPGMTVTVVGLMMKDVDTEPAGELGFRDEAPPALRLAGNADHPLVIGNPDNL